MCVCTRVEAAVSKLAYTFCHCFCLRSKKKQQAPHAASHAICACKSSNCASVQCCKVRGGRDVLFSTLSTVILFNSPLQPPVSDQMLMLRQSPIMPCTLALVRNSLYLHFKACQALPSYISSCGISPHLPGCWAAPEPNIHLATRSPAYMLHPMHTECPRCKDSQRTNVMSSYHVSSSPQPPWPWHTHHTPGRR